MIANVQAKVSTAQRTRRHKFALLIIAVDFLTLKATLCLSCTEARVEGQNLSPHFLTSFFTPIIAHAVKGAGCGLALRRALDWCAL